MKIRGEGRKIGGDLGKVSEKIYENCQSHMDELFVEVAYRGKEEGKADAFLIEGEIENGWIVVEDPGDSAEDIADSAGIDAGEAEAIMLARSRHCPVLVDDLAARRFASGLGLEVTGSIGVVVRAVKVGLISRDEGLDALDKLALVMWLSVGVYEDVRKVVEGLG